MWIMLILSIIILMSYLLYKHYKAEVALRKRLNDQRIEREKAYLRAAVSRVRFTKEEIDLANKSKGL